MRQVSIILLSSAVIMFAGFVIMLSRQKTKLWRNLLLICSGGLFLISLYFIIFSDSRPRIASLPQCDSTGYDNIALTGAINNSLKNRFSSDFLIHDLSWFKGALPYDSLLDGAKITRQSSKIGIDFLILTKISENYQTGMLINYQLIDVEQFSVLFKGSDSLNYAEPRIFFENLSKQIMPHLNLTGNGELEFNIPDLADWKTWGLAEYHSHFGEPAVAAKYFTAMVEEDSVTLDGRIGLASALIRKGFFNKIKGEFEEDDYINAEKLLRGTSELYPLNPDVYRLLGRLYIQRERWSRSEYYLKKAFELNKDDPFTLMDISRLHLTRILQFGFKSRLSIYLRCLELNPAMIEAVLAAGNAYYFQNRSKKAEDIYNNFLEINSNSIDALMALGKIYVQKNDVINIISIYQQVIKIDPDYANAYYNLGIAYFNDEKLVEAIGFFNKALELGGSPDNYYYLGVIHARLDEKNKAIDYFRKRIQHRSGRDDLFAEEARKILYQLLNDENYEV